MSKKEIKELVPPESIYEFLDGVLTGDIVPTQDGVAEVSACEGAFDYLCDEIDADKETVGLFSDYIFEEALTWTSTPPPDGFNNSDKFDLIQP